MKQLRAAHDALWVFWRAFHGWLRCLRSNKGSPRALGRHIHAWWPLRSGRRHIARIERALGLDDCWRP